MSGTKKFVYLDNGITKVVRGVLVLDRLHTYTLKAERTHALITLGKSAIVKVIDLDEEEQR